MKHMINNKKTILLIGLISLFILSADVQLVQPLLVEVTGYEGIIDYNNERTERVIDISHSLPKEAYVERGTIDIDSDEDFVTLGFLGSGTTGDPYLIENYHIISSSRGIFVRNTIKHFIIQNCWIESNDFAIGFWQIENGTAVINNNTCSSESDISPSIHLDEASGVIISENLIDGNWIGIEVFNSRNIVIANNNFTSELGLDTFALQNSVIANNSFNKGGISLNNPIISEDEYKYEILNMYLSNEIYGNTIKGKELGVFINAYDIIISSSEYGQIILINSTYITIKNQVFSDLDIGIALIFCTDCKVLDNVCNYNRYGILSTYSSQLIITNNTCNYNENAIKLEKAQNVILERNTCNNNSPNDIAVLVSYSIRIYLFDNTLSDNGDGLLVETGEELLLYNNIIENNTRYGIQLRNVVSSFLTNNSVCNNNAAIVLTNTENSVVNHNTISFNKYQGMSLYAANYNNIFSNIFQKNDYEAIYVNSESQNNIICYNSFIDNIAEEHKSISFSQCYDHGENTTWYESTFEKGNYWSDLGWKNTYKIDGGAGAADIYPLVKPLVAPEGYESEIVSKLWLLFLIIPFVALAFGVYFYFNKKKNKLKKTKPQEKPKITVQKRKKIIKAPKKKKTFGNVISSNLRRDFVKGMAIGIMGAIILGSVVGITLHFSLDDNVPDNEPSYTTALGMAIRDLIPEVVHVEIVGNGTIAIHPRLIWATMDRVEESELLTWNVNAQTLDFVNGTPVGGETDFIIYEPDIINIAESLFTSVSNTTKIGTYGVAPYDYETMGYTANIYWGMRLYLANTTVIQLLVLEDGLIFVKRWTGDISMMGADILEPLSAFDDLLSTLQLIFAQHLDV